MINVRKQMSACSALVLVAAAALALSACNTSNGGNGGGGGAGGGGSGGDGGGGGGGGGGAPPPTCAGDAVDAPAQPLDFTNNLIASPSAPGNLTPANHAELKHLFKVSAIQGFRAPRLEVNDNGLNALKAIGYQYDENLEEILPEGQVDAAIAVDTDGKKGFNWVPWPYTLDNGSPG